jgi:adenylate cyclase
VLGLLLARLGALSGVIVALVLAAAYVAVVRQLFVTSGAWLNVVYPLLSLAVVYASITLHGYVNEQRERRRLASAFGQYVSPVVIQQMLAETR